MKILKNRLQLLIILLYLGFLGWWISFQSVVSNQGLSVKWYSSTYGVVALIGSVLGFYGAQKWGGFKTILGKSLMFFSLGLFMQAAGQSIFTYYLYALKVSIPYPSWGDIAYLSSTISYLCGAFFLAKTTGAKYSLKASRFRIVAFLVPAILLSASYMLLLYHHQYDFHKPVTVFLDLSYPIGDALYISFTLVAFFLSFKLLGGVMRAAILTLVAGLSLQYLSDFTFLYQSNRGTYVSGKIDDLIYPTAYFITTLAMIKFYVIYKNLNDKNQILAKKVSVERET